MGGRGCSRMAWSALARASSCTWEGMGRGTSCRACQQGIPLGAGEGAGRLLLRLEWALDWRRPWPFLTGEAGKDPQAARSFLWCILEREHSALKYDSESHSGPRGMDRVPCARGTWYCRGWFLGSRGGEGKVSGVTRGLAPCTSEGRGTLSLPALSMLKHLDFHHPKKYGNFS